METEIIHNTHPYLTGKDSNYYEHRKEALRWIQKLGGKVWTDYNSHDPGVTILETLCYILTEIEFKLDFPIEDILYSSPTERKFKLNENALYLAEDIFTTAPVTLEDYRKLIIDNIHHVNNAWVLPGNEKGKIIDILLLKKKQVEIPKTIIATRKLLAKYRGFGTQIGKIQVVDLQYVALHVDLHLDAYENPNNVLAQLFFDLNQHILNPVPQKYTVSELEQQGMGYTEIFDGPLMKNGILKDENSTIFSKKLNLFNIKEVITSIKGVKMIDNLSLEHQDTHYKKEIELHNFAPFFTPKATNDIRIYQNNQLIPVNYSKIQEIIERMAHKSKREYQLNFHEQPTTFTPGKHRRSVHDYYSLKHDLPGAYGLRERSYDYLKKTEAEKIQQLKAYLLPFEQVFSNTFMQLAHLKDLYSIYPVNNTYYQQPLAWNETLLEEVKEPEFSKAERRDRFLTHLLGRFDVRFDDRIPMYFEDDELVALKHQIECKENMLQQLTTLTSNRNVSGRNSKKDITSLERELYLRLGILEIPEKPFYRVISELDYQILEVPEKDVEIIEDYTFTMDRIQNFQFDLYDLTFHSQSEKVLEELLGTGVKRSLYEIVQPPFDQNHFYIILSNEDGTEKNLISIEESHEEALKRVLSFRQKIYELSKRSEGFYLLDHALLKLKEDDPAITAFRMSFVFPAWSARFQKKSFQQQVNTLIYRLVPAHVNTCCLWLPLDDMIVFEKLHKQWKASYNDAPDSEMAITYAEELKLFLLAYEKEQTK